MAVSTGGGTQPRWRRDGKELFFLSSDSKMMAAAVTTTPEFKTIGSPISLFAAPVSNVGTGINAFRYDVSRDGQRFLIDARSDGCVDGPLAHHRRTELAQAAGEVNENGPATLVED